MPLKIASMRGKGIPKEMKFWGEEMKLNEHVLSSPVIFVYPRNINALKIDAESTSSSAVEFRLPNVHAIDPMSVALRFNVTVGGDFGMVANAISWCQKLTLQFQGTVSGNIEEIDNFHHFNYMINQTYGADYLNSTLYLIAGYTSESRTTAVRYLSTTRVWNGREFCVPIELGFFTSQKKIIPCFALPDIVLTFTLDPAPLKYMTKRAANITTIVPSITVSGFYIVCRQIELSQKFQDNFNDKLKSSPLNMDFLTWVSSSVALTSPQSQVLRLGNNVGMLTKIMFALGRTGPYSPADDAGNGLPTVGFYPTGLLTSYQFEVSGKTYPPSPFNTAFTTLATAQNGAAFHNTIYANGGFERDERNKPYRSVLFSDPNKITAVASVFAGTPVAGELPDPFTPAGAITNTYTYANYNPDTFSDMIYTYDFGYGNDALSPIDGVANSADFSLILNFSGDPSTGGGVEGKITNFCYCFYQVWKCIKVYPNRVVEVIFNQGTSM